MNIPKLKGKMVECGINPDNMAKIMGIDRSTMYRKLNKAESITCGEAIKMRNILRLSDEEAVIIFLR
jgi:plasmid maintenance system antidote protein VapI